MQFIFVEFFVTLEIILHGVYHGYWRFVFILKLSRLIVHFSSTNIFRENEEESIMQVLRF